MIDLTVTNRLSRRLDLNRNNPKIISMRKLSKKEISLAREYGIGRYCLPNLDNADSKEFFNELNKFWDTLTKQFDRQNPFWRNVFSTKMQEWEKSFCYLLMVLYSISKNTETSLKSETIIFICESIEECDVCCNWGEINGWEVSNQYYGNTPKFIVRTVQELHNFFNFLVIGLKLIVKKAFSPKAVLIRDDEDRKILISTLYYGSCFENKQYRDHFFGNLEDVCKEKKYKVEYIAYPLGSFFQTVKKAKHKSSFFIPYSIITWLDLVKILFILFTRRISIDKAVFGRCDVSSLVRWDFRRFSSFFNFDAEVYYYAVKRLCRLNSYERLIQLYEGNVLEKSSVQAFKEYSSGKVVGYSHAVLYKLNLKIYRALYDNISAPVPDVIVTSGIETKRMLLTFGHYDNCQILSGCSLRAFPRLTVTTPADDMNNVILIALDGTVSTAFLLDWILLNFKKLEKHYKIILRGHPNVPVDVLLMQCINSLPDNFSISSDSLEDDLSKCCCVVYRQSSVGLQAIMNGIPAIQLNIDLPLNGDPIENLSSCKWIADNMDDLIRALKKITTMKSSDKILAMEKAEEYSKEYFTAPDHDTLSAFFR